MKVDPALSRARWLLVRSLWGLALLLVLLWSSPALARAVSVPGPTLPSQPSDADWAKILASYGFGDHDRLLVALQVVFAESGGIVTRRNATSGALGAWQFMPNTLADPKCAIDPVCSTKKAAEVSKNGMDWSKWQAFTDGRYQDPAILKRALEALAAAASGCETTWDNSCLSKLSYQGMVGSTLNVPSLSQASPLDILDIWNKIPFDQVGDFGAKVAAYMLGAIDLTLLHSFEAMWNATVGGEDNLGGQTHWGSVLMVDSTPVLKYWAWMLGICSSGLAVFLFMTGNILALFKREPLHDFWRNCVWLVVGVVGMAVSFWLMQTVLNGMNAFTNTVNAHVALELRSLSVYQDLAGQKFSVDVIAKDHFVALVEAIGILIVGIEMIMLFFVYLVRALKLWCLAVLVPLAIAAGFIPQGRGVTVWWVRHFLATALIKPINAVVFGLFLTLGVTAEGLVNVLVMIGMLWIMWLVPGWLKEAVNEQHIAIAQQRIHGLVASQWAGQAVGYVGGKLRAATA